MRDGGNGAVWASVDRLIEAAPGLAALRSHGLQLLAARRRRRLGVSIPDELEAEERVAAVRMLISPHVLGLVRDLYDGPIVVLKGPELAARYPDPALRPFGDLDLLVEDAEAVQQLLLSAGFERAPDPPWAFRRAETEDLFAAKHHCHPIQWPVWPLRIELHRYPSWPRQLPVPSFEELRSRAVPANVGVQGLLTLDPVDHALVLAAHSWARAPLGRLRDLVDISLLVEDLEEEAVATRAAAWRMSRMWATTARVVRAVLGPPGAESLPVWARNLPECRERTVFETHLERWLAPFWGLGPLAALGASVSNLAADVAPAPEEPWRAKWRRIRHAVKDAHVEKSSHDEALGPEARQLRR
jgi:hypothetical protein